MKFLFCYPTRSRPRVFKQNLNNYYRMLSNRHECHFHILMDSSDETMSLDRMSRFLSSFRKLTWTYSDCTTKIQACNCSVHSTEFDIMVLVSDDMEPEVKGFDDVIYRDMMASFPGLDGALHYNDGGISGDQVITLSIIGVNLYKYFGYVYHPDYVSLFCDQEFTDVVRALGKVSYNPRVIVRHKWIGNTPDELSRHNESFWDRDQDVYTKRKAAGFPEASVL